jgi:hypothetical protein
VETRPQAVEPRHPADEAAHLRGKSLPLSTAEASEPELAVQWRASPKGSLKLWMNRNDAFFRTLLAHADRLGKAVNTHIFNPQAANPAPTHPA